LEEYGKVTSVKVIMDKETKASKKFGFVEMKNSAEALKAIEELDECDYDNSVIALKKANPRPEGRSNGDRKFSGNRR
jgi:RNA recognition motif-containing protein